MKVFVTGATGFIGNFLVKRLIAEGNEVIILTRNPSRDLPKGVRLVEGDLLYPDSWADAGYGCRRLYHLAAMVSFDPNKRKELLSVNGLGTLNILSLALRWNIETIVIASSACTMGLSYCQKDLLSEDSIVSQELIQNNPYLESKILAEKIAMSFCRHQKVVIVNPTTVYGPGDWSLNSGALVKKIASSWLLPVPFGGSNVIDVEDAVEGILLAGEKGVSGCRYIIGNQNLTFHEIFSVISGVIGKKPLFVSLPRMMRWPFSFAAGMIGRLTNNRFFTRQVASDLFYFKFYSTKLAESQLGFRARRPFQRTIERAWAFYSENNLIGCSLK